MDPSSHWYTPKPMIRMQGRGSLSCRMRNVVIITALMPEAAPLIEAWGLKPLRGDPLLERFQTHHANGVYLAVSGIGKLKAATCTSTVLSRIPQSEEPIVVNLGIAGSAPTTGARGELILVNKVRDIATNTRFYPDIILRHSLKEGSLETHDAPVTEGCTVPGLVDMEGAGFMQAATMLVAPTSILVLKVISDLCDGERISPQTAGILIRSALPALTEVITTWRTELSPAPTLSQEERALLSESLARVHLSATQTFEIERIVNACKAQGLPWRETLHAFSQREVSTKQRAKEIFSELQRTLQVGMTP